MEKKTLHREKKAQRQETDMKEVSVRKIETIAPPKFRTQEFLLIGTSPYMQARFSAKALQSIKRKMESGSVAYNGRKRDPRDFDSDFEEAIHYASDGWIGVPATAIRNACIDVCRMVGYKMTHAKMAIFVESDGLDRVDGTPLIKLIADRPERIEMPVRNATGVIDIRVRPLWREWAIRPRIRYDEGQFTLSDIANLLSRAGMQVGIGEGRPFSRESNGLGFGQFRLAEEGEQQ